jgi:hypothetical protein
MRYPQAASRMADGPYPICIQMETSLSSDHLLVHHLFVFTELETKSWRRADRCWFTGKKKLYNPRAKAPSEKGPSIQATTHLGIQQKGRGCVTTTPIDVGDFFDMISTLLNVVGSSCKRKDKLRENHQEEVRKAISKGELGTGTGSNQELSLQRPGDTRWCSHYRTLVGMSKIFQSVVKVLEYVEEDGSDDSKRRQANGLLKYFQSFNFVFYRHMMMMILALTNNLSKTL